MAHKLYNESKKNIIAGAFNNNEDTEIEPLHTKEVKRYFPST